MAGKKECAGAVTTALSKRDVAFFKRETPFLIPMYEFELLYILLRKAYICDCLFILGKLMISL